MTIRDDTGRELLASDARVPLEDAAFFRAVLEAVPAFILRLDPDRRINYINHLRIEPDLILLDRSMPGLPVKRTLAEIRKRHVHVPIIFFTGQDVPPEERAAVQDVLYKPLAVEELIRSVERWLS